MPKHDDRQHRRDGPRRVTETEKLRTHGYDMPVVDGNRTKQSGSVEDDWPTHQGTVLPWFIERERNQP